LAFLLIQAIFTTACKKELDLNGVQTHQIETTLEIEVRDVRNSGSFPEYWGYVFKVQERYNLPDTSFEILKYKAATNSKVIHKLAFEYLIYETKLIPNSINSIDYYFVACQDSNFYHQKITNTTIAKTNNNDRGLVPKKLNRIYAEFK
jgi:hypothetical protein